MVGNTVDEDFAYRLVSEKINGDIPDDFVRAAFKHKKIEIHSEISRNLPDRMKRSPGLITEKYLLRSQGLWRE